MHALHSSSFPQELPSRVFKSILVAADEDSDGYITVEEVEHMLENVGVSDKVTSEEISQAFKELGSDEDRIAVDVLKGLLTDQRGM